MKKLSNWWNAPLTWKRLTIGSLALAIPGLIICGLECWAWIRPAKKVEDLETNTEETED